MTLQDQIFLPPEATRGPIENRSAGGASTPPAVTPPAPVYKTKGEELVALKGNKLALLQEARGLVGKAKSETRALTPEEEQRLSAIETGMAALDARVQACEAAVMTDPAVDAGSNGLPRQGQSRSYDEWIGGIERAYLGPVGQAPAPAVQTRSQFPAQPFQVPDFRTEQRATPPIPAGANSIGYISDHNDKRSREVHSLAFGAWAGNGNVCTRSMAEAAQQLWGNSWTQQIQSKTIDIPLSRTGYRQGEELRVMTAADATYGANAVPVSLLSTVEKRLVAYAPIRKVANVFRTETGEALSYPTIDDSANKGRRRTEDTASTATDVAVGTDAYNCYEYDSDVVLISYKLLRDSIFDFEMELGEMLPERIGRKQADEFTTGTGSSQPQGATIGAGVSQTALAQTVISRRDLIKTQNALDQAYQENASWMFPLCVLEALMLLETTTGEPLFAKLSDGSPGTLLGKPWMINQSMVSAIAASAITVLYGDMKRAISIRDVGALTIAKSSEYAWAKNQMAFKAYLSSDCRIRQPKALVKLTQAA